MKICPVCKSAVPDDAEYCDTCGNDEFYSDYGQQQQFDQYEQPYQNNYGQQQYQQPYQNDYNQQPYQQQYQNDYGQQQYQQPYQNNYNQQQPYQQQYQNNYNQQQPYQQPYQNNYNQQPTYQQPYQNNYGQPQYNNTYDQQPQYQNGYDQNQYQNNYQQQPQQYQNEYEQEQEQYQQPPVVDETVKQPIQQQQIQEQDITEQPVAEEQQVDIQTETEGNNSEPEEPQEPEQPEEPQEPEEPAEPEEPKENPYEVSKNFVFEKKEPEQPEEPEKKEMPKNIKGFLNMFQNTKEHTHEFDKNDISKNRKNAMIACLGITFWYPFIMKDYSRFARYYGNQGLLTLIAMIPSTIFYCIITGVIVCNACVDAVNHSLTLGGWIASVIFFAVCYAIPLFMIYCSIKNIKGGKAKDVPFIGGLRLIS